MSPGIVPSNLQHTTAPCTVSARPGLVGRRPPRSTAQRIRGITTHEATLKLFTKLYFTKTYKIRCLTVLPRHPFLLSAPRSSSPPFHPSSASLPNAWLLCPPPFPRFVIAHVLPSSYTPPYGYPPAQPSGTNYFRVRVPCRVLFFVVSRAFGS
jgi:hypothetical protein